MQQAKSRGGWVAAMISVVVAVGPAVCLAGATPSESAIGPVIRLPKFVVRDNRVLPPPESWRYARLPGFEILSSASDRATQRLLLGFERFRTALDVAWPMPNRLSNPVLLVLCGHGGQFEKFAPAHSENGPETARISFFLDGATRTAVVVDMNATVVNVMPTDLSDPSSGVDSSQISVDQNTQLYREYVLYMLSRSKPRLPAWFEEGMAQIVMAMKFDRRYIEFGKLEEPGTVSPQAAMYAQMNAANASDPNNIDNLNGPPDASAPAEDTDFDVALQHRALMPMEKFFAVGHDSPEAMNPLGNNVWAKQAYAFVHMGLYGERRSWQKPFLNFLMRSTTEPVTEAMFKQCFNMSYRRMGIALRGYIQGPYYTSEVYKAKDKKGFPEPPPLVLRDATQAEVGRIKGEALLLGGHDEAARLEFIAPYVRGGSDPDLLAELGLEEHDVGKDDRSRKFLEAAVAGHATDPGAYRQLARFRLADAISAPSGPAGRISARQLAGIVGPLEEARTLIPPNTETYDLIASALTHSAAKPQKTDVAALIEGVRLFPGHMRLVYMTAALCAEGGFVDAARTLVEHGLKYAPDARTKANFTQLKSLLPPLASAGTPATSAAATPGK